MRLQKGQHIRMKEKEKQRTMHEQASRLKLLIDDLGLTQKKFGEAISMSPQNIGAYIAGRRQLSEGIAARISVTYGVSAKWLMTGNGDKFASSSDSGLKMQTYRKMTAEIESHFHEAQSQIEQGLSKLQELKDLFKP